MDKANVTDGAMNKNEEGMTLRKRKLPPMPSPSFSSSTSLLGLQTAPPNRKPRAPPSKQVVSVKYKDKDTRTVQSISNIEFLKVHQIDRTHQNICVTFQFSYLSELDCFLERQLNVHGYKFKNIKTLNFISSANELVLVQEAQLQLIMSLPSSIQSHLEELELGFGFVDDPFNSTLITKLLERCANLELFTIQHGIFGRGVGGHGGKDEAISIQIPEMHKLKKFIWAGSKAYTIKSRASTSGAERNHYEPVIFEIYFVGSCYPKLAELCLGYCSRIKFLEPSTQFPELPNINELISLNPAVSILWSSPTSKAEATAPILEAETISSDSTIIDVCSLSEEESPESSCDKLLSLDTSVMLVTYANETTSTVCNESRISFLKLMEIDNNEANHDVITFFAFSNLSQLDSFLMNLQIYASKLKQFEGLGLCVPDGQIYIGTAQMLMIASLPPQFLAKLKFVHFDFGFQQDIDSYLITQFLSKCWNLHFLRIRGGIFWEVHQQQQLKSIEIPYMPALITLEWFSYIPKTSSTGTQHKVLPLEINFSNHHFPVLEKINVGMHSVVKFVHLGQFPKLKFLTMASPWLNFDVLRSPPCLSVTDLSLSNVLQDTRIIQVIPFWFPVLECLFLNCPSVLALRTVIHTLSRTTLKELSLSIDYDFESGLTSALLNLPYTLQNSTSDETKLNELKQYKYWIELSNVMNIQIPQDCSSAIHYQGHRGSLGCFRALQKLTINNLKRNIKVPLDKNFHWENLKHEEVERSRQTSTWSSGITNFPMNNLMDEFRKLANILKQVVIENMNVSDEEIHQFQEVMGFAPIVKNN